MESLKRHKDDGKLKRKKPSGGYFDAEQEYIANINQISSSFGT